MIWVEILSRHQEVAARFRIAGTEARIGRGYTNDVIVDDPYVAPEHLRLFRDEAGGLVVEDLGTANGVFLDGSHIYEDVLSDIDAYLPKLREGGILFGHDLYDLPSRFDRRELLGIAAVNNATADYRNRHGEVERVDVHPGVILAVQDRFGDEIEHFPKSVVWAKQV